MEAARIAVWNTVTASDTELVAWARDGDDAAFGELFRRYRPRVAAFSRAMIRDESRTEDVVQETFLSALRRLRETDSEIVFKPWIFQIARNASIDVLRRGARADEVSIDLDGLPAADVARLPVRSQPDSSLIDKERFDHLRGALDELSESHHRIIVLRELEGLSYREIAERMELSPAAVESTLFRARRKLEHEYAEIDTGRRCQSMAALIGRLAEGLESSRDRRRLDRHARRCHTCRRRARELGIEPMLPRARRVSRVAAMLPLPAFLQRREILEGGHAAAAGGVRGAMPLHGLAGSALEPASVGVGKVAAVVAAAALVGGGGATLGGSGPLAGLASSPGVASEVQPLHRTQPLLMDDAFGRPLPAPLGAESRGRAARGQASPRSDSRTRQRLGVEVPTAPGSKTPTPPSVEQLPNVKAPAVQPLGTSDPRSGIRVPPPPPTAGAGAALPNVSSPIQAPDVKKLLDGTTAAISTLVPPPS